jgi:hypothetical protein
MQIDWVQSSQIEFLLKIELLKLDEQEKKKADREKMGEIIHRQRRK